MNNRHGILNASEHTERSEQSRQISSEFDLVRRWISPLTIIPFVFAVNWAVFGALAVFAASLPISILRA